MQQFTSMISCQEPMISGVLGYLLMVSHSKQSVLVKLINRMLFTVDTTVTLQSILFLIMDQMEKFFCALNYPGIWADSSLTA